MTSDIEIWKPVEGHPGYEVSNKGRFRRLPRKYSIREVKIAGGKILKPTTIKGTRYLKIMCRHRITHLRIDVVAPRPLSDVELRKIRILDANGIGAQEIGRRLKINRKQTLNGIGEIARRELRYESKNV